MTDKLTAKDFQPGLLVALATLTKGVAGTKIKCQDAYAPVCAYLSIEEDALGVYSVNGRTMTHELIGRACKNLKRRGLTKIPSMGKWTITEAGLEEARNLGWSADGSVTVPDPEYVTSDGETLSTPPPPPEPEPEMLADASFVTIDLADAKDSLGDDQYIRGLLADKTDCFGFFEKSDETCAGCPLARSCQGEMLVKLSAVASKLRTLRGAALRAFKGRSTKAELSEGSDDLDSMIENLEDKPTHDTLREIHETDEGTRAARSSATLMESALDCFCERCGGEIKKGERVGHVTGVGIFHESCLD